MLTENLSNKNKENEILQPLWKTDWWFITKLNIVSPYDLATGLLGIYYTPQFKTMFTSTLAHKYLQQIY